MNSLSQRWDQSETSDAVCLFKFMQRFLTLIKNRHTLTPPKPQVTKVFALGGRLGRLNTTYDLYTTTIRGRQQTTQSTWNTPKLLTIHHIRSDIQALMQRRVIAVKMTSYLNLKHHVLTFAPGTKASSQFVISVER